MTSPPPAAARRSAYALFLFLLVVAMGMLALGRLPFALLPSSASPRLHIDVQAPGLHAAAIEAQVTRPLEAALSGVRGVEALESLAVPGVARITLRLSRGADQQRTRREAEERLRMAVAALPVVLDAAVSFAGEPAWPAVEYVLAARGLPAPAFAKWIHDALVAPLEELPLLARVTIEGPALHEIQARVDARRLAGLGLSLDDVIAAVRRHVAKRTAAPGTTPAAEAEALAATPVTLPSGEGIALSETARVTVETRAEAIVRDDGEPVLLLAAYPDTPWNAYRAAEAVKAHIAWLQANRLIPEAVELRLLTDRAAEARRGLKPVALGLLGATLLVLALVQALFGALRLTLLAAASLAGAFSLALAYMAASGLVLDLLALGALTAGIGILVLPALLTRGMSAAARRRFMFIGAVPVLTVLAALWPSGEEAILIVRGFVAPLAVAWLGATLTAIYLAPHLVPPRSVRGLGARLEERTAGWRARAARRSRRMTVLIASTALASLAFAASTARHEFLPALDTGRVHVAFQADGALSLKEAAERIGQLERLIREIPGTAHTLTRLPGRDPWRAVWAGEVRAQLDAAVPRAWRRELDERLAGAPIPGLGVEAVIAGPPGLPAGRESNVLRLRLRAPAPEGLYATGDEIARRLAVVAGLHDVRHDGLVREQIVLELDRERAVLLGIEDVQAARALAAATTGIEVSRRSGSGREGTIRLLLPAGARIPLLGEVKGRPVVYLHDVGVIEYRMLPALIRHEHLTPMLEITARLAEGQERDAVLERVRAALADHVLPAGYALEYANAPFLAGWDAGAGSRRVAAVLLLVFLALWASRAIPDGSGWGRGVSWPGMVRGFWPALIVSAGLGAMIAVTAAVLAGAGIRFSLPVWAGMIVLAALGAAGAAAGARLAEAEGHGENVDRAMLPAWVAQLPALVGPLVLAVSGGMGTSVLRPFSEVLLVGGALTAVFLFLLPALSRMLFKH